VSKGGGGERSKQNQTRINEIWRQRSGTGRRNDDGEEDVQYFRKKMRETERERVCVTLGLDVKVRLVREDKIIESTDPNCWVL
jgi:hypothetical protein